MAIEVRESDRRELREMFASRNVVVTDVEFDAMFRVQTAMREMHAILSDEVDATITPRQFLDLSERNASVGFAGFKAILGNDRYRTIFETDATENLLPIDPDVFLAAHEKDTA